LRDCRRSYAGDRDGAMTGSRARLAAWRALMAAGLASALAAGCSAAMPAPTRPAEPLVVMANTEAYPSALRLRQGLLAQSVPIADLQIRLVAEEELDRAIGAGEAQLALVMGEPAPQLWAAPIASLPIRLVVNAANPLEEINEEDLRSIFAGNLSNWRDVGETSRAVRVITQDSQFETARAFQQDVLGGGSIGGGTIVAPSGWAVAQAVGDDAGAIGYLMCNDSTPRVRPLRIVGQGQRTPDEIGVQLFAIAPRAPSGAALEFLLWTQGSSGQQAVLANCGE
jgi:phosphate transport system substrate-binding protein